MFFWAVPLNIKNDEEGHPRLFSRFWAHSKAVPLNTKMVKRGTPAFFLVFWAHSKAVSRNTKNGEERRRALVKHGNARAGERHQLVGHQMNEQVRHRAVQALEGEPGKVSRAGADTTQRHLGHALGGKAGNEAVAQVAHAADVDVAHRVVVSTREDGEEVEVLRGFTHHDCAALECSAVLCLCPKGSAHALGNGHLALLRSHGRVFSTACAAPRSTCPASSRRRSTSLGL